MRGRKLMALASVAIALGLVAGCGSDDDDEPSGGAGRIEESTPSGGGGDTIKVAVLSDCEGAFGSFFEPTASGFNQAADRRRRRKAGR